MGERITPPLGLTADVLRTDRPLSRRAACGQFAGLLACRLVPLNLHPAANSLYSHTMTAWSLTMCAYSLSMPLTTYTIYMLYGLVGTFLWQR